MSFRIHRPSKTPVREQIARELSDRIRSGILEPGSQLPSVRDLAEELQVSMITVVHSYRLLERDGLVESVHGKGTFVRGNTTHTLRGITLPISQNPSDWQLSVVDYLPRAAVWQQHRQTNSSDVPYKMSIASLQPQLAAEFTPASRLTDLQNFSHVLSTYGPVEGHLALRESMADDLRESGVDVTADSILVTNGVQQAIDLVARTLIGPGDVVVVEAPTYPGAIDIFRSRGAVIVPIPMDDEGIRIDLLLKQCDRIPPKMIYTMPTFQNPTGIVMSPKRRVELLDVAASYHILIVEDDSFSDCSFMGRPPKPILDLDQTGHVIYIKGFSKMFLAGCRIASVTATGSIHRSLVAAKAVSDLGSPTVTQSIMHAMLLQPHRKQKSARVVQAIQRKRDIVLKALEEHAPRGVSWTKPAGGFNIWITLPYHINTTQLLDDAVQRGVSFLPGAACHVHDNVFHQFRLSFAYLEDDALQRGVEILCNLLFEALSTPVRSHLPLV